jgi:hypothetical protein
MDNNNDLYKVNSTEEACQKLGLSDNTLVNLIAKTHDSFGKTQPMHSLISKFSENKEEALFNIFITEDTLQSFILGQTRMWLHSTLNSSPSIYQTLKQGSS